MSQEERTPILQQTSESPIPPTLSKTPSPTPDDDTPSVTSPRLVDSVVLIRETGYFSRDTFQCMFTVLSLLHGLLNVGVWVSLGVTIYYLEGSSAYYWAIIGVGSQMFAPTIQSASVASRISSIGYKQAARMGLKSLINIHISFLVFLLLSSLACVGVSVTYGIRYGKNGENVVNKNTNFAVGVLNVALSSVVAIVTAISIYFAAKLRKYLLMANGNSGPFARDGSYAE